jgi:hypothetical protein
MMMPQPIIGTRFWNTALKLVMMAVMRSISRSSSSGIATTVVQNSTKEMAAPTAVPTIRKPMPSGVVVTTSMKAPMDEKDLKPKKIASSILTS